MSTLDVVAQAGGAPANFLDAGGGSKAEAIVDALTVITSDEKVTAILFNIFGGITRCDEIAKGIVDRLAADRPRAAAGRPPRRHQLRGGAGDPRRGRACPTCTRRRRCSAPRAASSSWRGQRLMSIIVDKDTKLVVSGLTGREGSFHGLRNQAYGTDLVAGRHARQGRPGRRGRAGLRLDQGVGRGGGRQHLDDLRAGALRRAGDRRGDRVRRRRR